MIISKIIKKIFINKFTAELLINLILNLHNLTYRLATIFSTILNGDTHPKHNIIQYEKWFYENIRNDDIVMDIGCNTGGMASILSEKAEYVYGIEVDKDLYNEAKIKIKKDNVKFICFDATIYDYSECRGITVVTLSNVLEHIENRVDFLKKIVKQVSWGGKSTKIILIRVPMIDRDWISVYKKMVGVEYRLDRTHYIEYTYSKLKDELGKSNITIISSHIRFGELYAKCKVI